MKKKKKLIKAIVLSWSTALIAFSMQTTVLAASNYDNPNYDELLLLIPDDEVSPDVDTKTAIWPNPKIAVWQLAAQEEGFHLTPIKDSAFIALVNAGTASQYKGIVLGDEFHPFSNEPILGGVGITEAIKSYVNAGGKALLTFDFGVMFKRGEDAFYFPTSPFSDMAGVTYSLYQQCYPNLSECYVGRGKVTGKLSDLQNKFGVPPGKSMPYTGTSATTFLYSPITTASPTGLDTSFPLSNRTSLFNKGDKTTTVKSNAVKGKKPLSYDQNLVDKFAAAAKPTKPPKPGGTPTDPVSEITGYVAGLVDESGNRISQINYDSFVATGKQTSFTELLTSPQYGPQAGVNTYGLGQVLFMNLPLGKYKSYGTDGMLLHGALNYFAHTLVGLPKMATVPNGIGGLVMNVHVDCLAGEEDDTNANLAIETLETNGIWNVGPFSVDFVAGPDCTTNDFTLAGPDNLGMNVANNEKTKEKIRYFKSRGYDVGSHGGWIHDFYGVRQSAATIPPREDETTNPPEKIETDCPTYFLDETSTNCVCKPGDPYRDTSGPDAGKCMTGVPNDWANPLAALYFKDFLTWNKQDIERVLIDKEVREYSAPEGNMPRWTVQWAKCHGIVGYYSLGNTGLSPTRMWRQIAEGDRRLDDSLDEYGGDCPLQATGQLKDIWAFPLTPYHLYYATFDDMDGGNFGYPPVSCNEVTTWVTSLVDFASSKRTLREFYFHPPGVVDSNCISGLKAMEDRATSLTTSKFRWYTMPQMADFLTTRRQVNWTITQVSNSIQITAAALTLDNQAWILPKAKYGKPTRVSSGGNITVTNDTANEQWVVAVTPGNTVVTFKATIN